MIVEKAGLKEKPAREDIRVVPVSGMEMAMGLGGLQVTNLIMLGVYMELAKPLSPRLIEDELRRSYSDVVLERNTRALKVGMEVGRAVAAG
jgi:Pyruvate/2-oxoacid:ferredoxin oxidoreductase gamma subunit